MNRIVYLSLAIVMGVAVFFTLPQSPQPVPPPGPCPNCTSTTSTQSNTFGLGYYQGNEYWLQGSNNPITYTPFQTVDSNTLSLPSEAVQSIGYTLHFANSLANQPPFGVQLNVEVDKTTWIQVSLLFEQHNVTSFTPTIEELEIFENINVWKNYPSNLAISPKIVGSSLDDFGLPATITNFNLSCAIYIDGQGNVKTWYQVNNIITGGYSRDNIILLQNAHSFTYGQDQYISNGHLSTFQIGGWGQPLFGPVSGNGTAATFQSPFQATVAFYLPSNISPYLLQHKEAESVEYSVNLSYNFPFLSSTLQVNYQQGAVGITGVYFQ